jgi:hypothetical protein
VPLFRWYVKRGENTMSLYPLDFSGVPDETARVARTAFPKGNVCTQVRLCVSVRVSEVPLHGGTRPVASTDKVW